MRRTFDGRTPSVDDSAFVSEMAYLVGDVTLERRASVWPFVCLRGDYEPVHVGRETNVQEFTTLHGSRIGSGVTIGHNAVVDCATVEDDVLVGIGSSVLRGATVSENAIVAAGAVVREGTVVPEGHLAYGVPAETQPLPEESAEEIRWYCEEYLELSERYRGHPSLVADHATTIETESTGARTEPAKRSESDGDAAGTDTEPSA